MNADSEVDPKRQLDPGSFPLLARLKHILGVDRAIAFTVLARGWSIVAGVVTLLLVARFLSPGEQGYYYTFSSLVALQVVFELGFSFVILQLAAHECAQLHFEDDGVITGSQVAHSRLASVLQKAVRWYRVASVLMTITLLPAGYYFFHTYRQPGTVHWGLPWCAAVLATFFTFQVDPILAFLEGCGRIHEVALVRFTQVLSGSLLAWTVLLLKHGLFAPAMIIAGQAIAGLYFLFTQRDLLLPLLRRGTSTHVVSWGGEIWPFQWRIAISWLCGYFIFQLFNPVLFAFRGATEAGQMGMSLSITSALGVVAISWINTKASPFGTLVARRERRALDMLFFRSLWQSTLLLVSGIALLLLCLVALGREFPRLEARVLPIPIFTVLLATTLCNHIVFSEAIYLRAHKCEPFLYLSILVGVLTAASTIITGRMWGSSGVAIGYFCTSGLLGLFLGTYIFNKKRNQWHEHAAAGNSIKP